MAYTSDGRFRLQDINYYLDDKASALRSTMRRIDDSLQRFSMLETDDKDLPIIANYMAVVLNESKELMDMLHTDINAIRNELALQKAKDLSNCVVLVLEK